jgi:hypothetical protein
VSDPLREWSPSAGAVGCAWVGALAAMGWLVAGWVSEADPAGLLIAAVAAVGLVIAAAFGTRARPRLRVDADGVTVGGMFRSRHHPWPLVKDVRVLRLRRFGRQSSYLEIDTVDASGDEQLLVFGRLDLAADPEDVAPQVLSLRP